MSTHAFILDPEAFQMRNPYNNPLNPQMGYNCPQVQCQECNCDVDCVCPACENTVVQDTDLLCAHMTENINQNQNTICEFSNFFQKLSKNRYFRDESNTKSALYGTGNHTGLYPRDNISYYISGSQKTM